MCAHKDSLRAQTPNHTLMPQDGLRRRDTINGCPAYQRHDMRQEFSTPLVADLHVWMREQRGKLSGVNDVAKAMDYMLKRWAAFAVDPLRFAAQPLMMAASA